MQLKLNRRLANIAGALACAVLMGYALYSQHVLLLEPCPLCIFQRVAVISVGVLFLLAAIHNPGRTCARIYGSVLGLTALAGIGVAGKHIWIQAQPPGSVPSCGASLDYLMDIMPVMDVIKKVLFGAGECAKIDWQFLGLSMPWWVAIALTVVGAWGVFANFRFRV
jgi:disulfide bond formation protein DsbB